MKNNRQLVEYAKKIVGLPYWYGTYGQIATYSLLTYKKNQYPGYYRANDFKNQIGKKVFDCIGVIKGFLWSDTFESNPKYDPDTDVGACTMYRISKEKGKISSMPNIQGILLFKGRTPGQIHHVGVYADGYVYEAKGHKYGCLKTKFNKNEWQYWSKCPFIEYLENDTETNEKNENKNENKKEEEKTKNINKVDYARYYDKRKAGTYRVNASSGLNVRAGAGVEKKKITALINKTKIKCYGYYSKSNGQIWLLIEMKNGKTGFACADYLRRIE